MVSATRDKLLFYLLFFDIFNVIDKCFFKFSWPTQHILFELIFDHLIGKKTFIQLSWPTVYNNSPFNNVSPGEVIDPAGADERVFDSGCDRLVGRLRFVPLGQPCLLPDPHPVLVSVRLDAIDNSAGELI